MLKRIREAQKNEDGFTLIELLLVIIILGVLAGIVVFAVNGISDRGNAAACKADKKNVEIAAEAFYAQSTPPAWAADLPTLVSKGFLREAPATDKGYTISYDGSAGTNTGKVTATGVCT